MLSQQKQFCELKNELIAYFSDERLGVATWWQLYSGMRQWLKSPMEESDASAEALGEQLNHPKEKIGISLVLLQQSIRSPKEFKLFFQGLPPAQKAQFVDSFLVHRLKCYQQKRLLSAGQQLDDNRSAWPIFLDEATTIRQHCANALQVPLSAATVQGVQPDYPKLYLDDDQQIVSVLQAWQQQNSGEVNLFSFDEKEKACVLAVLPPWLGLEKELTLQQQLIVLMHLQKNKQLPFTKEYLVSQPQLQSFLQLWFADKKFPLSTEVVNARLPLIEKIIRYCQVVQENSNVDLPGFPQRTEIEKIRMAKAIFSQLPVEKSTASGLQQESGLEKSVDYSGSSTVSSRKSLEESINASYSPYKVTDSAQFNNYLQNSTPLFNEVNLAISQLRNEAIKKELRSGLQQAYLAHCNEAIGFNPSSKLAKRSVTLMCGIGNLAHQVALHDSESTEKEAIKAAMHEQQRLVKKHAQYIARRWGGFAGSWRRFLRVLANFFNHFINPQQKLASVSYSQISKLQQIDFVIAKNLRMQPDYKLYPFSTQEKNTGKTEYQLHTNKKKHGANPGQITEYVGKSHVRSKFMIKERAPLPEVLSSLLMTLFVEEKHHVSVASSRWMFKQEPSLPSTAQEFVKRFAAASEFHHCYYQVSGHQLFGYRKRYKAVATQQLWPTALGGKRMLTDLMQLNDSCVLGLEKVIHAAMLAGDLDIHSGNVMLNVNLDKVDAHSIEYTEALKTIADIKQAVSARISGSEKMTHEQYLQQLTKKIKFLQSIGAKVFFQKIDNDESFRLYETAPKSLLTSSVFRDSNWLRLLKAQPTNHIAEWTAGQAQHQFLLSDNFCQLRASKDLPQLLQEQQATVEGVFTHLANMADEYIQADAQQQQQVLQARGLLLSQFYQHIVGHAPAVNTWDEEAVETLEKDIIRHLANGLKRMHYAHDCQLFDLLHTRAKKYAQKSRQAGAQQSIDKGERLSEQQTQLLLQLFQRTAVARVMNRFENYVDDLYLRSPLGDQKPPAAKELHACCLPVTTLHNLAKTSEVKTLLREVSKQQTALRQLQAVLLPQAPSQAVYAAELKEKLQRQFYALEVQLKNAYIVLQATAQSNTAPPNALWQMLLSEYRQTPAGSAVAQKRLHSRVQRYLQQYQGTGDTGFVQLKQACPDEWSLRHSEKTTSLECK